jgi:hypothetical protein
MREVVLGSLLLFLIPMGSAFQLKSNLARPLAVKCFSGETCSQAINRNSFYGKLATFRDSQRSSSVRPRSAATTTMDPWLSEKDVDKILRELGPGSMRPSPLVPAERYTSRDWLLCLLTLPTALEFRRVFSQLLANTIFAVMVWAGYIMYPQTVGFLTAGLHPGAHLLLGGALGLLLVFRTNTAYDRFWEARRLWGFLISRMREVGSL